MQVQTKEAEIRPTGADDDFPGTFDVVLSAPTEDRDGETLRPDEWKQPLPAHITFDIDHGMSVASTVGSGTPRIDDAGNLVVSGTYSSLPRAQDVRTLVREGHIRTTSVAFMVESNATKNGDGGADGGTEGTVTRELLNGAFVAVPSNREALILASKSLAHKAGRRNSDADAAHIQAIHDHAAGLGASCQSDSSGAASGATGGKAATEPTPPTDHTGTAPAASGTDPHGHESAAETSAAAATAAAADDPAADDVALRARAAAMKATAFTHDS